MCKIKYSRAMAVRAYSIYGTTDHTNHFSSSFIKNEFLVLQAYVLQHSHIMRAVCVTQDALIANSNYISHAHHASLYKGIVNRLIISQTFPLYPRCMLSMLKQWSSIICSLLLTILSHTCNIKSILLFSLVEWWAKNYYSLSYSLSEPGFTCLIFIYLTK